MEEKRMCINLEKKEELKKYSVKRSFLGSLLGHGGVKDKILQKQIVQIKGHEGVKVV